MQKTGSGAYDAYLIEIAFINIHICSYKTLPESVMLHELIYTSIEAFPMQQQDLLSILEEARDHNSKANITGLLFYYNGEFIQIIEGKKDDIFHLFENICEDDRHKGVRLFWDAPINKRGFKDWHMGFAAPDMSELLKVKGYSKALEQGLSSLAQTGHETEGRHMMTTLRDLLLKNRSSMQHNRQILSDTATR